jgi:hypothetical protein
MWNQRAATRLERWRWITALTGIIVMVAGCNTPGPPTSPTSPTPATPVNSGSARLTGQVIDADTELPIAGATVTTTQISVPDSMYRKLIKPPQPASAMTDAAGRFEINASFPSGWADAAVGVSKPGYESNDSYSLNVGDVFRVYPTLTIAAGQTIETRVYVGNYACGWESWTCRRVVVSADAGEELDLETTPIDGTYAFGVVIGEPPRSGNDPPTRVTAAGGHVWLLSSGERNRMVRVRLTARRR